MRNILILTMALGVLPASAENLLLEKTGDEKVVAKELIREWVATEKLLSDEAGEWKVEKARVTELLDLYGKELKLLNEELEKTGSVATTVGEKKSELEKQISDSKAKRVKLKVFLRALTPRVLALVKKFPAPLQDQLVGDVTTLTEASDESSVRTLLQATVNVIEAGRKFNRGIYQNNQVITAGDEKVSVEVIYLGLGRAFFYVGNKAGVGKPSKDGWQWERKDELLGDVVKAVDVFKKTTQPQLVELPLKVEVVK